MMICVEDFVYIHKATRFPLHFAKRKNVFRARINCWRGEHMVLVRDYKWWRLSAFGVYLIRAMKLAIIQSLLSQNRR